MPIVSGLFVPKSRPTNHFGNIRWLEPVVSSVNHHDYNGGEDEAAQDEEEPEEP